MINNMICNYEEFFKLLLIDNYHINITIQFEKLIYNYSFIHIFKIFSLRDKILFLEVS